MCRLRVNSSSYFNLLLSGRPVGYLAIGKHGGQFLRDNENCLKKNGAPYTVLDNVEFRRKYPMLRYPPDYGGLYDPDGGMLRANKILDALQVSGFWRQTF